MNIVKMTPDKHHVVNVLSWLTQVQLQWAASLAGFFFLIYCIFAVLKGCLDTEIHAFPAFCPTVWQTYQPYTFSMEDVFTPKEKWEKQRKCTIHFQLNLTTILVVFHFQCYIRYCHFPYSVAIFKLSFQFQHLHLSVSLTFQVLTFHLILLVILTPHFISFLYNIVNKRKTFSFNFPFSL